MPTMSGDTLMYMCHEGLQMIFLQDNPGVSDLPSGPMHLKVSVMGNVCCRWLPL